MMFFHFVNIVDFDILVSGHKFKIHILLFLVLLKSSLQLFEPKTFHNAMKYIDCDVWFQVAKE
jgi:hypothetical protein